jgi:hypothetical protein
MKRTVFVSSLLVCLLTLSLIFVSCDSDKKDDTIPNLTDFITLATADAKNGQWKPKTTFSTSDTIEWGIKGTDSDLNITKLVFSVKKDDGTVVAYRESPFSINTSPFTRYGGYYTLPKGNYTIEVYAEDAKNNKSNKLSKSITVN